MFLIAEGRCEGWVTGRFRGANFPLKHGADGPFGPDFRAVIEADDGAVIMVEWHGSGCAYPLGHRADLGTHRRLMAAEVDHLSTFSAPSVHPRCGWGIMRPRTR